MNLGLREGLKGLISIKASL